MRGYFTSDQESILTEEYQPFVDELRGLYPNLDQPTVVIPDVVSFIFGQPALESRLHLTRLIKLSCLCLEEPYAEMPTVKFRPVRTDDLKSRFLDTVPLLQSFLMNVCRSIETLSSDESVSKSHAAHFRENCFHRLLQSPD